jgi:hypothetical protein
VKSNVIGLFLITVAKVIVVISIITSISVIERQTGLYDKILYSYNVEPYNKQFIPTISNIANQVPPSEPLANYLAILAIENIRNINITKESLYGVIKRFSSK